MIQKTNALVKALSETNEAVVYALDATALVQESMERVEAWPPATKHLGQGMMASLLLQALSDVEEKEGLSLQWMCPGPFGHLYVESRNYGECRGTIHNPRPLVQDYDTTLGPGILQVRRTIRGNSTTSIVNSTGDVSNDVVEYLEKSEQKNCGINLSVVIDWDESDPTKFKVKAALAYLIHILPQPTEQKLSDALVRWNRQMATLGPISRWALRPDQITLDMLRLITGEENPNVVMSQRVLFACNCTEERAMRALSLLENQEKKEGAFHSEPETEIRCEYCGRTYTVKATDEGDEPKPAKKGKRK
jgi:redox-regulated HSP33 family molecular chaperone